MACVQNMKRSTLNWKMLYLYIGTAIMILLVSCSEGETSIISSNFPNDLVDYCTFVTGLTCIGNQFACGDEKKCIPMHKFCDGTTDCR